MVIPRSRHTPWPLYLVLIIGSVVPGVAQAAVTITEVAWMGSSDSANHEWIELYNDGSAVDVTGWQLSDGASLHIELTGTIGAGQYAVLERSSDAAAAGTAFLIYTGALVNSGATLTLRDAADSVIDQVVGGTDWVNIGGDNTSKATAQRSGSSWQTAAATPGQSLAGTGSAATNDESDTDESSSATTESTSSTVSSGGSGAVASGSSVEALVLTLPDITLELDIIAPGHTQLNQPTNFTVDPSGIGETLLDSLKYTWNFGDGTTATGQTVSHVYQHPGRYVVVVEGGFKRQQQVARAEIEVRPVTLALGTTPAGDVLITNESDAEINVGGYRVVGHMSRTLPPYTIVLPGQSLTVTAAALGLSTPGMVALYDETATPIATLVPATRSHTAGSVAPPTTAPTPPARISALSTSRPVIDQSPVVAAPPPRQFGFRQPSVGADVSAPTPTQVALADTLGADRQAALLAATIPDAPSRWPQYALVGVLLLSILALLFVPRYPAGRK